MKDIRARVRVVILFAIVFIEADVSFIKLASAVSRYNFIVFFLFGCRANGLIGDSSDDLSCSEDDAVVSVSFSSSKLSDCVDSSSGISSS